jgi:POT family proton-dependent oligopeptide transporter
MTTANNVASNRFPPQIRYIIGNEACERFSYYGIRSILALYISTVLYRHLPDGEAKDRATSIIHTFIFANYFTPLIGAWLSDKLWGRYNTILYVSLIYCLGNAILALGVGSIWGLYIGLAFVALGSGGIKPCVSAFCGDQFRPDQAPLLQKAYGLFYWSINFGSFFSFLVIPWVKDTAGYRLPRRFQWSDGWEQAVCQENAGLFRTRSWRYTFSFRHSRNIICLSATAGAARQPRFNSSSLP